MKIGASTLRHFCSNFAGTSSIALALSDDLKQVILISIIVSRGEYFLLVDLSSKIFIQFPRFLEFAKPFFTPSLVLFILR